MYLIYCENHNHEGILRKYGMIRDVLMLTKKSPCNCYPSTPQKIFK